MQRREVLKAGTFAQAGAGLQVQLLRFPPRVAASPLLQRLISVSVMVPQSWPVLALCIGPR